MRTEQPPEEKSRTTWGRSGRAPRPDHRPVARHAPTPTHIHGRTGSRARSWLLPLVRSVAHPPRGDWVGTLLLVGASEEFMDQYRSAFRCAEVRALVDCFHLPLQVVSVTDGQASLSVVADGEEWSGVLERLVSTYQRLGVTEPVPRTLEVLEPMDGVSVVRCAGHCGGRTVDRCMTSRRYTRWLASAAGSGSSRSSTMSWPG